jgi:hypothetical protein
VKAHRCTISIGAGAGVNAIYGAASMITAAPAV